MTTSTSFTDAKGRTWDTALTMAAALRIDQSDFSAITEKPFSILRPGRELFVSLMEDGPLLFAVIYATVRPQVAKQFPELSDEDAQLEFLDGLDGRSVEDARESFWRALSDFFPRYRTDLSLLKEQSDKAAFKLGQEIARLGPEVETLLAGEIEQQMETLRTRFREMRTRNEQPGTSSTGSPPSSVGLSASGPIAHSAKSS